jgi:hypothetical protein
MEEEHQKIQDKSQFSKKKKTEKIVAVFIDQRENYEWALDGP